MNQIIYIVGLVVIVLAILSFSAFVDHRCQFDRLRLF